MQLINRRSCIGFVVSFNSSTLYIRSNCSACLLSQWGCTNKGCGDVAFTGLVFRGNRGPANGKFENWIVQLWGCQWSTKYMDVPRSPLLKQFAATHWKILWKWQTQKEWAIFSHQLTVSFNCQLCETSSNCVCTWKTKDQFPEKPLLPRTKYPF